MNYRKTLNLWKIVRNGGLAVLLSLLLLELTLYTMTVATAKPGSFALFLPKIPQILQDFQAKNPTVTNREIIFFIGDSTMYGIGASDPLTYSLAPQLEALLRQKKAGFYCINLGYPGMCTEEGLQIMRLLPAQSQIIFRAGISDGWNPQAPFRFFIGSLVFELRSLKMFALLRHQLHHSQDLVRIKSIQKELRHILHYKKHHVYALGYPIYPSTMPFYDTESPQITVIPLGEMLQDKGWLKDGIFPTALRCEAFHSNDIGYRMEAQFIFNFLCEEQLFGLTPEQKIAADIDPSFIMELRQKYDRQKNYLYSIKEIERFSPQREYQKVFDAILEIWTLSALLAEFLPEKTELQQEHERSEKLRLLVFHDIKTVITYFSKIRTETRNPLTDFYPDPQKSNLYYNVMKVIAKPQMKEWQILQEMVEETEKRFFILDKYDVPYIPNLPRLFPLENCPRLVGKRQFAPEDLQTAQAWETFFSLPYQELKKYQLDDCQI